MALARSFAEAVAAKDSGALIGLLAPDVDFRAMTPGRFWEASTAASVVDDIIFGCWLEAHDHVEELMSVEVDDMADRTHLAYRLRVRNDDGPHLVEQQAYLTDSNGRIAYLRVMCSGFRPIG